MKRLALLLMLLVAACQPTPEALPTLVPTATQTATPAATHTPTATPIPSETPTATATATATLTPTPTLTNTPRPTLTLVPSRTPAPTQNPLTDPTRNAQASATAVILQRPVLSTFTPAPVGEIARPTSTGTPQVIADVVITSAQMREEVVRQLAGSATIRDLELAIRNDGVAITLTAQAEQAITSGTFLVRFSMTNTGLNNFLAIQADAPDSFIMSGELPPSDAFLTVAYNEVTPAVFRAFDAILNQRLGEGRHDLDNVRLIDGQIEISLLVPIR